MQYIANMILYTETIGKKKMVKFVDKVNTHAKEKEHLIILCGICLLNAALEV